MMSWRSRWRVYEYVRNSIWIVPALCMSVAVAMGFGFPTLDEHTSATIGITFGADAARGLLGAVAGGMITFTGFVFSILLLAVQFGSSQFSPRMLRRFLRDPSTKLALGLFMATFVYALLVLRVVGTGQRKDFVPSNSVSITLLLLIASMIMFLRLISRTTQGLRVAAVVADLGKDAARAIERMYPALVDARGEPQGPAVGGGAAARPVAYVGRAGVLQSIDRKSLVYQARKAGAVVTLVPRLGDLLVPGNPLFEVRGGHGPADDAWLQGAVAVGDERTMRDDPAFAFRLLADISAKALSPGVNDPTTSTQALDQIELLLRRLGTRRLEVGVLRDESGVVRLRYRVPTWEDYLSLAIDETRQYGAGSVQVNRRLRALLEDLREAVPVFRRAAVDEELVLLEASAGRMFADPGDRRSAATRDRQGLGASDVDRSPRPGYEVPEDGRPAPASSAG